MYRDQCIETPQGIFIKDLRVISNRDLKNILLVDNASYSFGYQLDNGIPIIPFYHDKNDKELLHLMQYLKCVIDSPDVREQNKKAFQLGELTEQEITEYLYQYEHEGESSEGELDDQDLDDVEHEQELDQDVYYNNSNDNDIMIQNDQIQVGDDPNELQNAEYFARQVLG